jgi:hypothetical protein
MNRKNIFRQVCQQAMGMTQKALTNDYCSYRSPSGPCLIGGLITDEAYSEKLESNGVNEDIVQKALKESNVIIRNDFDVDFLDSIQSAHDCIDEEYKNDVFKYELRQRLKKVAQKYNIPFPKFYKEIQE